MWVLYAFLGAVCTALTAVLAKIGIRDVKSNFATFYRTAVVILCSLAVCLISGHLATFSAVTSKNYLFLILSGLSTGGSWLCYYRALSLGDVNKVTPIDKSSFILTSILFLIFFFDDTTKGGDPLTIAMLSLAMILMLFGTLLMIPKKEGEGGAAKRRWLLYAVLSAVFASLVSLFVKLGLAGIPSDVGTLLRTVVVFFFAGGIVFARGEHRGATRISRRSYLFLTLSGMATGGAWLFEYTALNTVGVNPVAVNSFGKLSILLTMLFSLFVLKEKFSKKSLVGLAVLTAGIGLTIAFSL